MQKEQWSSRSYGYGREMAVDVHGHGSREIMHPSSLYGFRSYSMSHVASQQQHSSVSKIKKGNSMSWWRSSSSSPSPSSSSPSSSKGSVGWVFINPELQRKKRVAAYKAYSVESKIKGSLKKSVRWFKDRYARVVYG